MAATGVVEFFWKWQQRRMRTRTSAIAELALDKCEETLLWRDWERFGYWHAVYLRERRRLDHKASLTKHRLPNPGDASVGPSRRLNRNPGRLPMILGQFLHHDPVVISYPLGCGGRVAGAVVAPPEAAELRAWNAGLRAAAVE